MAFSSFKSMVALSASFLCLSACTGGNGYVAPDYKAENLIGAPLSNNSKLQSSTDDDSGKVVVFDKTIHKVHHFDLDSATHLGQYDVDQPDEDHYLIYGSGMKYFVDLTKRNINVQPLNGDRSPTPVKFVGTPISATFDSKLGYMVVYDSFQSVLIYKIDEKGTIVDSFISGPEIKDQGTIQAGDISAGGKLVLSIRGNPQVDTGATFDFLVSIDLAATLADSNTENKLIFEKIPVALTQMSWIAPVTGSTNLVMIRSEGKISLFDLTTKVLTSIPTDNWVVEKYSKLKDPHIVMRQTYDYYSAVNGNVERRLYYIDGAALKSKTLTKNFNFILDSHLDLKRGYWNVTKANTAKEYDLYNGYNDFFAGRSFTRIRMSDLLSVIDTPIDDKATVEIANDYLFSLFPTPLGFATRIDIETSKTSIMRNFNVKYMK